MLGMQMLIIRITSVFALALALVLGSPSTKSHAADVIRLGEGPFISGGGFYVAKAKGYFTKIGIELQIREFADGALAMPSFVSGELDISFMTPNASLFNSIAKGAPIQIILDRGHNRAGRSYTVINVTKAMADQGVHSIGDMAKLKGKRFGVGALGSINQFNAAKPSSWRGSTRQRTCSGSSTCHNPI